MKLTKHHLTKILAARKGSIQERRIKELLSAINQTLTKYKIDTPLRIAHFIAQVAHESAGFRYMEEIWPRPRLDARGVARNGNRWQLRYEGRRDLGNTQVGDGYRFRGRGLIQLTGRANYTAFGRALKRDLTSGNKMDAVAQPPLAVMVAGWFWTTRRKSLNALADGDHFIEITKAINGGTNGLADRRKYLLRAKRELDIKGPPDPGPGPKFTIVRSGDTLSRLITSKIFRKFI